LIIKTNLGLAQLALKMNAFSALVNGMLQFSIKRLEKMVARICMQKFVKFKKTCFIKVALDSHNFKGLVGRTLTTNI
jgi:hypothetical protein